MRKYRICLLVILLTLTIVIVRPEVSDPVFMKMFAPDNACDVLYHDTRESLGKLSAVSDFRLMVKISSYDDYICAVVWVRDFSDDSLSRRDSWEEWRVYAKEMEGARE